LKIVKVPMPVAFDPALVIFEDSAGLFWLGTAFGLYSYNEGTQVWLNRSTAFDEARAIWAVSAIAEDRSGRIWVRYGLTCEIAFYEKGNWKHGDELYPHRTGSLGRVLIGGKNGKLWFVSTAGLIAYDGHRWDGPFTPPQECIRGYDALGPTPSGRRAQFAGADGIRTNETPPAWTSQAWSGAEDLDGNVWLTADRAIWRFEVATRKWRIYPNSVLGVEGFWVTADGYGGVWFLSAKGLVKYYKPGDRWTTYELAERLHLQSPVSMAVYVDQPGRVILGTLAGNFILDEKTGETSEVITHQGWGNQAGPAPAHVTRLDISAVARDRQGRIWIACGDELLVVKQ
jgi:ligand-binding sensor domain-containing protein